MQKAAASSAGDPEEVVGPSQSRHLESGGAGVAVGESVGKNVGAVAGVGDDAAGVDQGAVVVREDVVVVVAVAAAAAANPRHTSLVITMVNVRALRNDGKVRT